VAIVPLPVDGVNAILAIASDTVVAVKLVGGSGDVVTVTAEDAAEVPTLFVALTVNEYRVLDDKLFNTNDVEGKETVP
jgi:hypothetical protein